MSLTGQMLKTYTIGPLIGKGGLGEVYQAFTSDQARVAIKVLRGELAQNVDFQNRFIREIRLMQAVKHDNIVPIYDFGVEDDKIYMVMKLIEGSTLTKLMKRHRFNPQTIWPVLRDIAAGVNAGHEQKIVHRDLKPDNILVSGGAGKQVKFYLADFGLSKRPGIDETLTATGAAVGTPEYISPEAAIGGEVDTRSDVYSLGVIIYELLVNVLPFTSRNRYDIAYHHIETLPPPLTDHHAEFPRSLQRVILKSLEKKADDRYQTTPEFADAYYEALRTLSPEQRRTVYTASGA
jgi:serine/threonine protein kinase